jgi:putative penicillin-binding protein 1A
MAVSPKLVVGAWVGGEYRSIHFRTGALGQGSKTALPICGEFIYSLMRDKAFQKYHAKWQLDPDEDIDPSMYNCQPTVVRRAAPDSLRDFTTGHRRHQEEEEEPIDGHENTDEGGFILEPAPQPTPERQGNSSNNESPQIIKKAKKPRSEDMEI